MSDQDLMVRLDQIAKDCRSKAMFNTEAIIIIAMSEIQCLTTALENARKDAWLECREEAMKVADQHWARVAPHHPDEPKDDLLAQGYGNAALNISADIRILTPPTEKAT